MGGQVREVREGPAASGRQPASDILPWFTRTPPAAHETPAVSPPDSCRKSWSWARAT